MFSKFHNSNKGFTLIELMIVVVIIGILAALAIPRFMEASAKTEAKVILGKMYTAEKSHFGVNDSYAGTISSVVDMPDDPACTYEIALTDKGFTAYALIKYDSGAIKALYSIDQDSTVVSNPDYD